MKIRKATASDVSALVALNRAVHVLHSAAMPELFRHNPPDAVVAEAFKAMIEVPSSYWLVAEAERIVAFLCAEFRQRPETWCLVPHHVCYIAGIAVDFAFRGKGVARALLADLKHEADVRGVNRIELDVWAFNHEARQAFAQLGFRAVMERMVLTSDEPNKAPEPTITSVMPRAAHESRRL